ncbi:chromosome partition protein MukB [Motilimonas cestriensis]|uniref:Chromosome partition protein MukB n=1 Tax=Motilimonas cestriensis TaxID=2742685 RepID=A0ABS8WGD5_9GAMM|nr:chromosome partition protein MukB [Motilimonas cestriensis]MCE2596826.1 chromosome partition protein MukB [Motilimonas cestriensis]
MANRGKFLSLTMVNWNGFFARTFELDQLVTTLSGGNGAGKSTTMAAFITAMIPDQTLLHFRNTTEAGSSNASRDKGLYGKLKSGPCYSMLQVRNSHDQVIWLGVHLEQIAGRDKKVNITPFALMDLPEDIKPTELLLETLATGQARVRQFSELRAAAAEIGGARVTKYNSINEYHNFLFDMGVIPKKMRDQKDRSKFYRLIEASLYGGISSTITRSLRDYLLPENSGIRKAFQDMEAAIKENRHTLERIKQTQSDRDLFKNLITETTHYVAAEYVRLGSQRQAFSDEALSHRAKLQDTQRLLKEEQGRIIYLQHELENLTNRESMLEKELEHASDMLQKVIQAVALQSKISQYQAEIDITLAQLEEQQEKLEQANILFIETEASKQAAEAEVDSLKTQLSDYQQALDIQQTRAIQYKQAVAALEQAKLSCDTPDLVPELAADKLALFKGQEEELTHQVLAAKHRLEMANAALEKFEQALGYLTQIEPSADRKHAFTQAKLQLQRQQEYVGVTNRKTEIERSLQDALRQQKQQDQVTQWVADYASQTSVNLEQEQQVAEQQAHWLLEQETQQAQQAELADMLSTNKEKLASLTASNQRLTQFAPKWLVAQAEKEKLELSSEQLLEDASSVSAVMQQTLQQEQTLKQRKEQLQQQKSELEQQIRRLQNAGGETDETLGSIALDLGGVLLSDVYDDIPLEDASYYSALYGPARYGVVVRDLEAAIEKLKNVANCPEDLYLIQGDPDAFDEELFNATDLGEAVLVREGTRQLRYSPHPKTPLFGRAAREARIAELDKARDSLIEEFGSVSFEQQKKLRLYNQFNDFIATHLAVVFEADPQAQLEANKQEIRALEQQNQSAQQQQTQLLQTLKNIKAQLQLLDKIQPLAYLIGDDTVAARLENAQEMAEQLRQAVQFLTQHKSALAGLAAHVDYLQYDPQDIEVLKATLEQVDAQLAAKKRQCYHLEQLHARLAHFSYHDAQALLDQTSQINDELKAKLVLAEKTRQQAQAQEKQCRERLNQEQQTQVALTAGLNAKQQTLQENHTELAALGVVLSHDSETKAKANKEQVQQDLIETRNKRNSSGAHLKVTEKEVSTLTASEKSVKKGYHQARAALVKQKSGWSLVKTLAQQNDVARRLDRAELKYLDSDELKSMSDKALGTLRMSVAHDEDLRDALRYSEDSRQPERKVMFYVSVYQHLKQRIRHDIIRSDDPVEAIEEMEIELARLTDELKQRESHLSISAHEVASKINNTIRREQNRIRALNQGLQSVAFGQVAGVRLNVSLREAYSTLLNALAEQGAQHQDLFGNNELSFSEAMAKLFQRLNPHIDQGERSHQVLGEALLDYRNYLEMQIEVCRGTEGWLRAESGALSTGEAIGTGQAILLMVLHSWEEESRRFRARDVLPCRLLFLDEAARLDARSISTLFELCERQNMQLIIAAPENISPENGTTYKLIRKTHGNNEHVHVVGLRGFGYGKAESEASLQSSIPELI